MSKCTCCPPCGDTLPATQHRGEPVALPGRLPEHRAAAHGWNAYHDEIAKLGPLYTHPAPVHQGEPVAWTYLLGGERRFFPTDPRPSHGAHANLITDAQPVYTHADAGESERLQRRIQNAELALKAQTQNCDTLRAQLAKRGTLLGLARRALKGWAKSGPVIDQIDAALSASAEPSARGCCVPSVEEKALLATGEYTPQELWGGSRPTCPKCFKAEPK